MDRRAFLRFLASAPLAAYAGVGLSRMPFDRLQMLRDISTRISNSNIVFRVANVYQGMLNRATNMADKVKVFIRR